MQADTITLQAINEQPAGTESAALIREVIEGSNLTFETPRIERRYGWQSGNLYDHVYYIGTHAESIASDLTVASKGFTTLGIDPWTSEASIRSEISGVADSHLRLYLVEDPRDQRGTKSTFAKSSYLEALEQFSSAMGTQAPPLATEHSSDTVDPFNIGSRLDEFRCLEDGWAAGIHSAENWGDDFGKSFSEDGLNWLETQFNLHYHRPSPRPYLYPTPDGGVQVEWSLGQFEVSLEICLSDHTAEWHSFDFSSGSSDTKCLNLDDTGAWNWVVQIIQSMVLRQSE